MLGVELGRHSLDGTHRGVRGTQRPKYGLCRSRGGPFSRSPVSVSDRVVPYVTIGLRSDSVVYLALSINVYLESTCSRPIDRTAASAA